VPRDRNGSFEPVIVPKKARRLVNINSVVLSLYSRGMTTCDIEAHLQEMYGAAVSRGLISNVTEVVVDEIKAWQSRPLDEVYPILYIDGLRLRIKDNGVVTTKVAYLAIGVDLDGRKHALGCWIQDTEGANFWRKVVIDLRNRGVCDILIACADALRPGPYRHDARPGCGFGHPRAPKSATTTTGAAANVCRRWCTPTPRCTATRNSSGGGVPTLFAWRMVDYWSGPVARTRTTTS
jgi:hypothetical protein